MNHQLLTLLLLFFTIPGLSQPIIFDDFDYPAGDLLTLHGWSIAQGVNETVVADTSLSFPGYLNSDIGFAAALDTNLNGGHIDSFRPFTAITSGNVYISALVHPRSIDNSAGFNFTLYTGKLAIPSGAWGRVSMKVDAEDSIAFGLAYFTGSVELSAFKYAMNKTYLVILKYQLLGGEFLDKASLYVFEEGDSFSSEPTAPLIGPLTAESGVPGEISIVGIKRPGGSNQLVYVDGIRVSTSWSEAPLPVELSSFHATSLADGVRLNWSTKTELNNYGFEIERKAVTLSSGSAEGDAYRSTAWTSIGFVAGKGTTNDPQSYSFVDEKVSGTVSYRLKQVDVDGTFEYSNEVEFVGNPSKFEVAGNYPNPFNPSTVIRYQLSEISEVTISVFNILGQKVAELVNEKQVAGEQSVEFNAAGLASGLYIYKVQAGGKTITRTMMLTK